MKQQYNQLNTTKLFILLIFIFFGFAQNSQAQGFISASIKNNGCEIATYSFLENFTTVSTPTYDRIDWLFGNGNVASGETPNTQQEATYDSPGTYFVTANLYSGVNIVRTLTREIHVFQQASPDFTADNQMGCRDLDVTFTDLTNTSSSLVGAVVERTWKFGDGNSYTTTDPSEKTITHTYTNVGDFQVTLIIKTRSTLANTSEGNPTCTGESIKTDYIKVRHPITASIGTQNVVSCDENGYRIQFPNASTTPSFPPPAGSIGNYIWRVYQGTAPSGVSLTSFAYDNTNAFDYTFANTGDHYVVLEANNAENCSSFTTVSVTIPDNHIVIDNLGAQVCQNVPFTFDASGINAGSATSWSWDIDGTIYNTKSPSHTFSTDGTKDVSVTATFTGGCTFTTTTTFDVGVSPEPDFVVNQTAFCAPNGIAFLSANDQTAGNTYQWTINGTNVSTDSYFEHTFPNYGNYTIFLTVTNAGGCTRTEEKTNHVMVTAPVANISADDTQICDGTTVNFDATGSTSPQDPIAQYEIAIIRQSDNAVIHTANSSTTSFALDLVGGLEEDEFYGRVFITTNTGCTDVDFVTVEVGTKPVPTFTHSGTACYESNSISFSTASGVPSSWTDVKYEWNFDDGANTETGSDDGGVSADGTTSHSYGNPGTFNPTLVVTHNGCESNVISLTGGPVSITGVRADFNATSTNCGGTEFTFNNTSVEDGTANAVTYNWDFGDGIGTSTLASPLPYTYASSGIYTVTLTATKSGCTHSVSQQVFVQNGADMFNYTRPNLCAPNDVTLTNIPDNVAITGWNWSFGDGQTASRNNSSDFIHTYDQPGTYFITLNLVQAVGGCNEFTTSITVNGPVPDFTTAHPSSSNACVSYAVEFTDASTNPPGNTNTTWSWDFRNPANTTSLGFFSGQLGATFTYTNAGRYPVILTLTDDQGCQRSATRYIDIDAIPNLDVPTVALYCTSEGVYFNNQSTGATS